MTTMMMMMLTMMIHSRFGPSNVVVGAFTPRLPSSRVGGKARAPSASRRSWGSGNQMDQRFLERMLAVLERQHKERAAGDQQRLNEQHAIAEMMPFLMRMRDDEEPPQGATSKAAPPRPPAQQPPQPQCPNGHGLVDFPTTTDKHTCNACQERLPKAYVTKACRACNYDLCQKCAGAPAALGRQQSGEGQRPRRRRTRRRSHDKNHQEGAQASRTKRVCRGRSQSRRDHSQSRRGGQDNRDHSQSASSRPRYWVKPDDWQKVPAMVKKLIVSEGKRDRQKERRRRSQATKRERSASPRSSSRSSSSSSSGR